MAASDETPAGLARRCGLALRARLGRVAGRPRGDALLRAYAAAFGATFLWGTQAPLMKLAVAEAGFVSLTMVRAVSAGLLLAAILAWRQGWPAFAVARADVPRMLALAFGGLILCHIGPFFALTRLPASASVILSNTSPIVMGLLAVLWLREPLRRPALAGLLVAFGGVALLVTRGGGPTGGLDLLGAAAALTGSIAWAGYTVAGRPLLLRYDPLRVVGLTGLVAGLAFVPLALVAEPPEARDAPAWVWLIAVYLGVLPIAVGNLLWYEALRLLRTAQVAAFQYLTPIWAVALAWVLLGEPLTLALLGSAVLVLAGLWLAQRR